MFRSLLISFCYLILVQTITVKIIGSADQNQIALKTVNENNYEFIDKNNGPYRPIVFKMLSNGRKSAETTTDPTNILSKTKSNINENLVIHQNSDQLIHKNGIIRHKVAYYSYEEEPEDTGFRINWLTVVLTISGLIALIWSLEAYTQEEWQRHYRHYG